MRAIVHLLFIWPGNIPIVTIIPEFILITWEEIETHIINPPYGTSDNTTWQTGVQVNHRLKDFLGGPNVLTFGTELVLDDVFDTIPTYNYVTDQETNTIGVFAQSVWQASSTNKIC